MAKTMDWDTFYRAARRNIQPRYRQLRRMDTGDWLATIGLEKRNILADVAGAFGFIVLGCAVGVGVGMLLAPKRGDELRRDIADKARQTTERINAAKQQATPTYAS